MPERVQQLIIYLDSALVVLLLSPAVAAMFAGAREVVGRSVQAAFPELAPEVFAAFRSAIDTGRTVTFDWSVTTSPHPPGPIVPHVRVDAVPVFRRGAVEGLLIRFTPLPAPPAAAVIAMDAVKSAASAAARSSARALARSLAGDPVGLPRSLPAPRQLPRA